MGIKHFAFAACLFISTVSLAYSETETITVKKGQNDYLIAHRYHMSVNELHRLNPGVKWAALQIGAKLRVRTDSSTTAGISHRATSHSTSTSSLTSYKVRKGDNDYRIAQKFHASVKTIWKLNPGIKWDALQIGHKLTVPGSGGDEVAEKHLRTKYAKIAADDVNVRRRPTKKADEIVRVSAGTRVTILSHEGDWYKVRFPKGTTGWVREDLLKPSHSSAAVARRRHHSKFYSDGPQYVIARSGNAIVDRALSMRGTRYSYGSASRHATDCSGLALQAYRAVGVTLPRTSREQSALGKAVSLSELKPGDLVFFRTGRSSRINHVGVYKGNGLFVHASSGQGEVTVSSLSEGYYRRCFAGARRIVKQTAHHLSKTKKHSMGPK